MSLLVSSYWLVVDRIFALISNKICPRKLLVRILLGGLNRR